MIHIHHWIPLCFIEFVIGYASVFASSGTPDSDIMEKASQCTKCIMWEKLARASCISALASNNSTSRNSVLCSNTTWCTAAAYFEEGGMDGGHSVPKLIWDKYDKCLSYYRLHLFSSLMIPVQSRSKFFTEVDSFTFHYYFDCESGFMYDRYKTLEYNLPTAPVCRNTQCTSTICLCNMKVGYATLLPYVSRSLLCPLPNASGLEFIGCHSKRISKTAFDCVSNLSALVLNGNGIRAVAVEAFLSLKHLQVLNITSNRLTNSVFQTLGTLSNVEVLNLTRNRITDICDHCLRGLGALTTLDLSGNAIKSLESGMQHVQSLQRFYLASNKISVISETFFHPLIHLCELNVSNNHIYRIYHHSLVNCKNLHVLDLSKNYLMSLPDLSNFKYLVKFLASGTLFSSLTLNFSESCCRLALLEHLDLSKNPIKHISPDILNCGHSLKNVALKNCWLLEMDSLRSINAEILDLSHNRLKRFSFEDVSPNLLKLDLSSNDIQEWLPDNGGQYLSIGHKQVKELLLFNNSLMVLEAIQLPASLEILDLSGNRIEYISFRNWSEILMLKKLNLTGNRLTFVCPILMSVLLVANPVEQPTIDLRRNPLKCSCEILWLFRIYRNYEWPSRPDSPECLPVSNTSNSKLDFKSMANVVHEHPFQCLSQQAFCQCNVQDYYVAKCELPCPAPCSCYISKNYDYYAVNCSEKNLSSLTNVTYLKVPSSEFFSHNFLYNISSVALSPFATAREMYLNRNHLKVMTVDTFLGFDDLKLLDLSHNLLESLPSLLLDPLKKLKWLFLNDNLMHTLHENVFVPLANLEVLHLHSNQLKQFPVWTFQQLSHLRALNLIDNPWSCECDYFLRFKGWVEKSASLIENASDLSCLQNPDKNGTVPFLSSSDYCVPSLLLVWVSIAALVVVTFLTISCVLIYLYRQEVQILVYSWYGIRLFQGNHLRDENKVYDVFIAYSGEDSQFVAEQLLPGLEQTENPYRVCVHHRDFLVGALITENILEAVDKSCRTIVVLSDSFANSSWCRFEFKTAHNTSLCDRVARLIIVVLNEIPVGCDTEMKLYLKTNTYLQWGDRLFWKKLYFALPDRSGRALVQMSRLQDQPYA